MITCSYNDDRDDKRFSMLFDDIEDFKDDVDCCVCVFIKIDNYCCINSTMRAFIFSKKVSVRRAALTLSKLKS